MTQIATDTTTPLLALRDLEVSFSTAPDATPAVRGVDLTVRPGERVAVVGESGSGKSTAALAVLGLLAGNGRITGGQVLFRGEDLTGADERRLRRLRGREIGLVPQDPMSNLNPVRRVGDQVAETLRAHGLASGAAARKRAIELMGDAGIPDAARRARQYPHEFSGGMRQRVLIAIGLACQPELLIADEPTSALDVTVQRQILDHLETLVSSSGTSLLFITHDLGLAADRADTVFVMSQGRVVEAGSARTLLENPQHEYTQRLVAAAPSVVTARRFLGGDGDRPPPPSVEEAGEAGAAGGDIAEAIAAERGATAAEAEDDVLVVEGLTKDYRLRGRLSGTLRAVDDVGFRVRRGSTTAIVGESGSGKSTVAKMVLGLETPTAGTVRLDGRVVQTARGAERRAIRRAMQPVFQDPYGSLNPMFTIERIVDEPLRVFRVGDRAARRRRVAELLDHVALPGRVAQAHPNELSGGQRQRVALARALALEPSVVICDEAVSALDVLVQDQVLRLLAGLQADLGLSYLFITHDLAVVRLIADDVLVMRAGRVVERDTVDRVFESPDTEYTRDLLDAIPGAGFFG
ncbi:dipeptide ABC transporter ATP-binding protein [Actinoalloteichus hymeniacidonis]|uniref:Iron ABC transporter ATP-binding protein n=1 Tax=Actinoalloteichus hymeniacidonis TaxID=340345 RepID=A0AAC9HRB7_9PSEU|nr:ABC transporter ATP-binding protein [Actinoalloteichus hymeniacidonis]AOS64212.1 iron ABC transporter ATP-binding protein [Actinoalloteichus hymeniacidonis]MBB5907720.1 peptide/nickel transport system ATP-binding protein [Actinoalloteichus hymeniacidonis]